MPPSNKTHQAEAEYKRGEIPSFESFEALKSGHLLPGDVIEISTENGSKYHVLVEDIINEIPRVRLLTVTRFKIKKCIMGRLERGRSVQFLEDDGKNPKRFLTSRVTDIRCKCHLVSDHKNENNKP